MNGMEGREWVSKENEERGVKEFNAKQITMEIVVQQRA